MIDSNSITVVKKNGKTTEPFSPVKIYKAIRKSADRVLIDLTDEDCQRVVDDVVSRIDSNEVTVRKLHKLVELGLDNTGLNKVAESYRQYRNYKVDAQAIMDAVDSKILELSYKSDKSNANCDSSLVSTKRSIIYGEQQSERYKRLFLNDQERKAMDEGFFYIHDRGARWDATNCELCNYGEIMKGGFVLSGIEYSEPKSVTAAIAVLSDIMSTISANTYGGNTCPEIDTLLAPYCEKSYQFYLNQYKEIREGLNIDEKKADEYAVSRVKRELEQGLQSIELNFNSVSSARGDFPFTTFTFGHDRTRWGSLVSSVILSVRKGGQGKVGHKIPVVFPKLVFLYDEELHGARKELEWLFREAVECTRVAQYPDYLSLTPSNPELGVTNYVGDVYHKWGKIVSPMGK